MDQVLSNAESELSDAMTNIVSSVVNEAKREVVGSIKNEIKEVDKKMNQVNNEVKKVDEKLEAIRNRIDFLMKKVDVVKRRDIVRFIDAQRHRAKLTSVDHMHWTAEALELITHTKLKDSEKRELVKLIYKEMSDADTNDFTEEFDVESAVEFIFDARLGKLGIKLSKTGILKNCLPCCSSVSVVADIPKERIDMEIKPLKNQ